MLGVQGSCAIFEMVLPSAVEIFKNKIIHPEYGWTNIEGIEHRNRKGHGQSLIKTCTAFLKQS